MQLSFRATRFASLAIVLTTAAATYSTLVAADKPDAAASTNNGLPLVLEENFSNGADRWQPINPEGWKIIEEDGKKLYSQFVKIDATKKLPHRSPWGIAYLKDLNLGDFVMEVKMRETKEQYPHRDCCLVFGYQDPAHMYYVHFASTKDDPHANQVFIVNAADRKMITEQKAEPVKWGATTDWHKLKIVRKVADGTIEAYFDDMEKPIEIAHDQTFKSGRIGIGTFDDTADFAEVKVWGNKARPASNEGIDVPAQPAIPRE